MNSTQTRMIAVLLTMAASLASSFALPARDGTASGIETGEVRMDHISVVAMGTGEPVVLIPGLSTPRAVWDDVAAHLAERYRVLLVQVNGFGGDDAGENLRPGVLDGIVADLSHYLDDNEPHAPAVIGHSMGGLAGMLLAARHPDSVGRLMIVDALPFFSVQLAPPGGDITVAEAEPIARQMRDAIAAGHGQPSDQAAVEAQVRGMAIKPENHDRLVTWARSADARVAAQALYENLTTDARSELAAIKAPITLVYPWQEQGPGKDRIDAFYRRQYVNAPDISYVDIADAAHFVMLDQPDVFREAVDGFLSD